MECRKFKVTLVSAENLPEARSSGPVKVYAEVSLNGEPETTMKTSVDSEGKSNPRWDFAADYMITESTVQKKGANVVVHLFCKRRMGSSYIGEVRICVKSLFDMSEINNVVSYHVKGTPNGRLNISYSFSEKILLPKASLKEKLVFFAVEALGLGALAEGRAFVFAR